MNISNILKTVKLKVAQQESKKYKKLELKTAQIKAEREITEEKASIRKNYYDEKEKLSKARTQKNNYSNLSQLKKAINERKKKQAQKENKGIYNTGGRNVFE